MNRQTLRQAKRLIAKGRFPFPEHVKFMRVYISHNPETVVQTLSAEEGILSNISGEMQTYTLEEFYNLITKLRKDVKQKQEECGENECPVCEVNKSNQLSDKESE